LPVSKINAIYSNEPAEFIQVIQPKKLEIDLERAPKLLANNGYFTPQHSPMVQRNPGP
jgi:hypothetical protein